MKTYMKKLSNALFWGILFFILGLGVINGQSTINVVTGSIISCIGIGIVIACFANENKK